MQDTHQKKVSSETPQQARRGRPTKFDPSFCERVIKLGREGASRVEMAAAIGINRDTLSEWSKEHPEFKEALDLAITMAQAWWEAKARSSLDTKGFNQALWIFNMKSRYPHDYREQEKTEKGGFNMAEFWARVPQNTLPGPTYEDDDPKPS